MELWIRSQDKERLIKVSTLFVEYNGDIDPTISSHRIVADKCIDLGIYKSKERALEVLDEIQNILRPRILVRANEDNEKVLLGGLQKGVSQKVDIDFKELSTYVYEMPKE